MTLRDRMQRYERHLIDLALTTSGGDVRAAAKDLGTPERTLWSKIRAHGISPKAYRPGTAHKVAH